MYGFREAQIRPAVGWLQKYKAEEETGAVYAGPMVEAKDMRIEIIDGCTDADLVAAGVDVKVARELAEDMREET